MHYQQPWLFNQYQFILDAKLFTSYQSEFYQQNNTSFNTQRNGGSLFLTKPIKLLSLRTGAGIRIEQVQPQTHKAFDTYLLNTLRVYVEINKVKNQINPTNGYRSKLIMDKGGHIFGVSTKTATFHECIPFSVLSHITK